MCQNEMPSTSNGTTVRNAVKEIRGSRLFTSPSLKRRDPTTKVVTRRNDETKVIMTRKIPKNYLQRQRKARLTVLNVTLRLTPKGKLVLVEMFSVI